MFKLQQAPAFSRTVGDERSCSRSAEALLLKRGGWMAPRVCAWLGWMGLALFGQRLVHVASKQTGVEGRLRFPGAPQPLERIEGRREERGGKIRAWLWGSGQELKSQSGCKR